jgi:hypothetical protein
MYTAKSEENCTAFADGHQTSAAPSRRGSSSERPPPSARAASSEPADLGTGAAPGLFLWVVSVCVGVSFVGFGLPAGAGLGLAPGASATRAFL